MHDPADHAAVIDAGFAPDVLGQMWLDLPPLFVAQPKQIASHRPCSESKPQRISNRFSQQQFYWVLTLVVGT
jgi:hypothetical protein